MRRSFYRPLSEQCTSHHITRESLKQPLITRQQVSQILHPRSAVDQTSLPYLSSMHILCHTLKNHDSSDSSCFSRFLETKRLSASAAERTVSSRTVLYKLCKYIIHILETPRAGSPREATSYRIWGKLDRWALMEQYDWPHTSRIVMT